MNTIKPDKLYMTLLLHLKAYPDGLTVDSLASYTHISYFVVYQRLQTLKKYGYVQVKDRIWTLCIAGQTWYNQSLKCNSRTVSKNTQSLKLSKPPSALPPKRLNGMRIYYKPNRTEHAQLEAKLAEAGIAYSRQQQHNYVQYTLDWQGYALKFTTLHLILYCPHAYAGFERKGGFFINEQAQAANKAVAALAVKLNIRMLGDDKGKLWFRVAYFELAHTQSTTAKAVTRKQSYKPLCYDMRTGECIAWADNSFNLHELEFSRLDIEGRVADMLQDMEAGKWNNRAEQVKLAEVAGIVRLGNEQLMGIAKVVAELARTQNATAGNVAYIMRLLAALQAEQHGRPAKRWEFT